MFSTKTYIERRKRLKESVKSGLVILMGNNESSMNYLDNTYPFRQDSTFLYFFGLNTPGLIGIIDIDNDKEIIYGNDLTIDDIVWMGKQPSLMERSLLTGVKYTQPLNQLSEDIKNAKSKKRKIRILPPYRSDNKLRLSEILNVSPNKVTEYVSPKLIQAVVDQRSIKSREEIIEIEKAVNITADMHIAGMKMARPGMRESQVAAAVTEVALAANGGLSFPVIATINGQTLHNHHHGNIIKEGDLFLLDAGAETEMGYAGDMSSTFPVSKTFTQRQKDIYQIALNSHEAAIAALKPGVKNKDIHLLTAKVIVEGMKDLGLMKGNADEAVAAGAHALFFPCGLGHMMGLDTHDMEDLGEVYVGYDGQLKSTQFGLKSLRLGRELQSGFVITIEPGIYFIPELIDMWKAENINSEFLNYDKIEGYRNFGGVRNEEDFLITDDGARLLGKPIPKTIEDVEAMRQ
jgi:Xaa-Pro aminopeptidase